MKKLHEEGRSNVKPNFISFTNVLHAWSNSAEDYGADKAESIMKDLLNLYNISYDDEFQPSVQTWNILIDAWVKRVPMLGLKAVRNAYNVFHRMEQFGQKHGNYIPDTTSYNILMQGLSKSSSSKATSMAEELFDQMQSCNVLPNKITFNNLLNVYAQAGDTKNADMILSQMENGPKHEKPDTIRYVFLYSIISRYNLKLY